LPLKEQQRKFNINLFWVRYEVTRVAALCQESEPLEELEETGENQYTTFTADSGQPTTIYNKYRYRGSELPELCFYEYCCQVTSIKLQYSRASDLGFDKEYPNYDSLCQQVAKEYKT
jgi:hypothetical protein